MAIAVRLKWPRLSAGGRQWQKHSPLLSAVPGDKLCLQEDKVSQGWRKPTTPW